jgi:hypothetical protein
VQVPRDDFEDNKAGKWLGMKQLEKNLGNF